MLTPEERKAVGDVTRVTQSIIGALFAGVLSYLVFCLVQAPEPAEAAATSMPLIGVVFAVGAATAAVVVPRIVAAQNRAALVEGRPSFKGTMPASLPTGDAGPLLLGFQTRRIIAGALLEGAAFFNVFVYQTERQTYTLSVVVALLLGLLTLFPLRPLVEQWLEREMRTVRELRDLQR